MQFEAGISLSRGAAVTEGPSLSPSLNQDALWQMNLRTNEAMESGSLPERPGEPDCSYYIRTGLCRFGATCRFNHPPNRKLNEIECAYYLRTGQCKFGSTCKFHHPQPNNMMVSLRGSPVYPTVQSPTTPSQQSYAGGITNWSRASFIPSPRWQGPSSYAPMLLPQGMGQLGSVSSSENLQQTSGNSQIYGASRQTEPSNSGSQGTMSPFRSGSIPVGFYALQRESVFPERPGQPECQFYMKTGDCKFGAVCRFHHPRERLLPVPDCVLSPIGLPLRPGEPLCIFYSRYGICKFGPSCKFDHPMGIFTYNLSASSSADAPVRRFLGSSSATGALNLSSEGLVEAGSGRRLSLPETRQMSSGDDEIDTEG
ncbi:zinc finger CCCH domain-containing protein 63 [Citrus sinensis]|nr:zinc finger CCCH domain-containing protein 63 [Citrus sinensis]